MRTALYVDAVRHARPRQAAGRVRRVVPASVLAAGLRPGVAAPAFAAHARGLGVDPAPQSGPTAPPHETAAWTAVGATRDWHAPAFWEDDRDGLLFLFELHGFSELSRYVAGVRSPSGDEFWEGVLGSWLTEQAPRPRFPGWHPYPTSDRLIAWAAALSAGGWPERLHRRLTGELWRQARYLRRVVEHDIGGNHVLRNATALCLAGAVLPSTPLLPGGLALLEQETGRQLLPDGAHEERSPAYHRRIAHDLADVAAAATAARGAAPEWLQDARTRMRRWQRHVTGPDGCLPLLGDAWEGPRDGAGPSSASGARPSASGHVRLGDDRDVVILDAGPIGPAHLPAHAHADALSFVLWMDGAPVVVDPGALAYTGPDRRLFRSTAMHNTVEVDGQDQCSFWGDFRAAHLPDVRCGAPRVQDGLLVVSASHDGYRRLSDPVVHHRTVVWCPGDGLVVIDRLCAKRAHAVRSSVHLAPGPARDVSPRIAALGRRGVEPRPQERPADYAPYLGTRVSAAVLEDRRTVDPGEPFGWSILRAGRRVTAVTTDQVVLAGAGEQITVHLDRLG